MQSVAVPALGDGGGDDADVELDVLGVDRAQHLEPGVAGADVVEGDLESLRAQVGQRFVLYGAGALVALLVILIALVVANTRTVKVSWVLGSTRQSLVWIILAAAILSDGCWES